MKEFAIFTDSACDISPEMLVSWNVKSTPLYFHYDSDEVLYSDYDVSAGDFYAAMRQGKTAKTSAANTEAFSAMFEDALKDGCDVLYLGFSSGLSTTYNAARIAASALAKEYPENKLITIDTLAASAGEGLIVYLAVKEKEKGKSIDEVAEFVKTTAPKIAHWFTVDDLVYLKRGGRISALTAFVGGVIGIKPLLHVDDCGKLVSVSKVRGRRTSIEAMAKKFDETAEDKENATVFISHSDCIQDAELLAKIIKEKSGATVQLIADVGAVIGSHSGPGTLALFFVGKER